MVSLIVTEHNYLLDFSAVLFKSARIFEYPVDGMWLLFTPDYPGEPVVVDRYVHAVLSRFEDGEKVSEVIRTSGIDRSTGLEKIIGAISFLEEKGFIRKNPSLLPYDTGMIGTREEPSHLTVWLHITNDCNLSCQYCFVQHKSESVMDDAVLGKISRDLLSTALTHGINTIHIKYAGGEPTLEVPRIERFHNLLNHVFEGTGIEISSTIYSNGTLVQDRLISFLTRSETGISVSVDGIGPYHDCTRSFKTGRGSWEIVKNNLEKLKKTRIDPYILATVTRDTITGLPDLLLWANQNRLRLCVSSARQYGDSDSPGRITADYHSLCKTLKDAYEKAFAQMEDPTIRLNPGFVLQIEELNFSSPSFLSCNVGQSFIVYRPDGTIVSCPFQIDDEGATPSGDLLESSRGCFRFDPTNRRPDAAEPDCPDCLWFPVCGGGCCMMNLKVRGYPFTKSPMCPFYQYIIPRYLIFQATKFVQGMHQ
jgi:uncharacterized protein